MQKPQSVDWNLHIGLLKNRPDTTHQSWSWATSAAVNKPLQQWWRGGWGSMGEMKETAHIQTWQMLLYTHKWICVFVIMVPINPSSVVKSQYINSLTGKLKHINQRGKCWWVMELKDQWKESQLWHSTKCQQSFPVLSLKQRWYAEQHQHETKQPVREEKSIKGEGRWNVLSTT